MFKKLIVLFLITKLSLSNIVWGCEKPVTLLDKGEVSPCRGYLFSPEKELEVRILKKEYDFLESENQFLNRIIIKYKDIKSDLEKVVEQEQNKTELWRLRAVDTTEKYISSESNRTKRDVLFFALGIVTVVAAAYAIGQASK